MRLNRYLSQCGIASRRGCEQIILEGRVSINGHVIKELATQVTTNDNVVVDGKQAKPAEGLVVAFHKPKGFICTKGDTHGRATIYHILPPEYQELHYVGRLDKESEGLLLLTNRGELTQRLSHPTEGVEKEYEVTIDNDFNPEHKLKLLHGMLTEEGYAKAEHVWVDSSRRINVVLKQGLKRQIRLMFYQLGYEVERLIRIRVGGLYLKGLPKGAWKELNDFQVERYFIKHKERERQSRPMKDKPGADEGEDSISSTSAGAPFKLRPGPKARVADVRKPRHFSESKGRREDRPARFDKKFGHGAKSSRDHFIKPEGKSDEEAVAPRYDSDMPASRKRSEHKPKRFTKSRELRSERPASSDEKPRSFSKGPRRSFGKPERSADEGERPRSNAPAGTTRQESRKRFGESSKTGGAKLFAKKHFKSGNKPSRKGMGKPKLDPRPGRR